MAPVLIPFWGSIASVPVTVDGVQQLWYPYVNTKINHNYAGKRVRIKILSWSHRPQTATSILCRLDFSEEFQANPAGTFAGFNGETISTNSVRITQTPSVTYQNYFQNNTGVGLFVSGNPGGAFNGVYGTPVFEGMLIAPTLTITFRPASQPYTSTVQATNDVTTGNFGYGCLILDIETIE